MLFHAINDAGHCPRVVFSSSIAVFGGPFPEIIPDDFHTVPLSSYGTQKAMIEALLVDYTRRGYLDGVGHPAAVDHRAPLASPTRLPRASSPTIIREPLVGAGRQSCRSRARWCKTHASPRSAISFLLYAAQLDGAAIGPRRNLSMPGVAVSVGEQIEALERVCRQADRRPHPRGTTTRKSGAWCRNCRPRFAATRARDTGLVVEQSYDEIIRAHIEDELGG